MSHQIGWWCDAASMSGGWQTINQCRTVEPIPFGKRVRWLGILSPRAVNTSKRAKGADDSMEVGCLILISSGCAWSVRPSLEPVVFIFISTVWYEH